jgi:hypothetical protein
MRHAAARAVRAQVQFTHRLHEAQQELLRLQDQVDRSEQAKQVCAHAMRPLRLPARGLGLPLPDGRDSLSLRRVRAILKRPLPRVAQDKEDANASLERKASKLEAIFNSEKETLYGDVDELTRRSESVLSDALAQRSQLVAKRTAAQHALTALTAEVDASRRQWQREREEMYSALIGMLDRLMNHKEHIRDRLQSVLAAGQFAHGAVSIST